MKVNTVQSAVLFRLLAIATMLGYSSINSGPNPRIDQRVELSGGQANALVVAWKYLRSKVTEHQGNLANYNVSISSSRTNWRVEFSPAKVKKYTLGAPDTKVAVSRIVVLDKRNFSKMQILVPQ